MTWCWSEPASPPPGPCWKKTAIRWWRCRPARSARSTPACPACRCAGKREHAPLKMPQADVFGGVSQHGQALLEIVAQGRHAEQIVGGLAAMAFAGEDSGLAPAALVVIAAADPGQGNDVADLVVIEIVDGGLQFGAGRVA